MLDRAGSWLEPAAARRVAPGKKLSSLSHSESEVVKETEGWRRFPIDVGWIRMHNPFAEHDSIGIKDVELVEKATNGDRSALEELILRHQTWIYNIAVRMVHNTHDAEEVMQEVLVKVITKLGTFRSESTFRTWLNRIVANHVLNMKRRPEEKRSISFTSLGSAIDRTPELDLPDPNTLPVDVPLLVEEAKIACTTAMLLCLDRRQRLVFTLGEILCLSDTIGGEVMEMTPDNFRQCLARARRDLHNFMNNQCGLVNKANPCRCAKKTRGFIAEGHVDPNHLVFASHHLQRVREVVNATVRDVEEIEGKHAAVYRDHPFYRPDDHVGWLRRILASEKVQETLGLARKNRPQGQTFAGRTSQGG